MCIYLTGILEKRGCLTRVARRPSMKASTLIGVPVPKIEMIWQLKSGSWNSRPAGLTGCPSHFVTLPEVAWSSAVAFVFIFGGRFLRSGEEAAMRWERIYDLWRSCFWEGINLYFVYVYFPCLFFLQRRFGIG